LVIIVLVIFVKLAFDHTYNSVDKKMRLKGAELKMQRAIIILEKKQEKIEKIKNESNKSTMANKRKSQMLNLDIDSDDSEIEQEIKRIFKKEIIGTYGILSEKT
jgi:methionyl-tRNA formyltransferase